MFELCYLRETYSEFSKSQEGAGWPGLSPVWPNSYGHSMSCTDWPKVGKRQREAQSHEIIGRWTLKGALIDWMWELCGGLGFLAQAFGCMMELLTEKGNAGRGAGRNTVSSVLDTWIRATCEGTKLRCQAHSWICGPGGRRRRDLGGLFGCLWHRVDNGSHVTPVGL